MLYSMKDYVSLNITYPITIRNYLNAICNRLGLTFKNANDTFANYNKQIPNELYIDSDGKSLGYTFRDVLDELAQVTASTICINEEDDELEIRYINQTVGKNLLNPNRLIQTAANGITCSYDKDTQIITFNGTCTADNTTFYFSNSVQDISEVIGGLTTLTAYYISGSVTNYFYWRINNSGWTKSKNYNLLNIATNKIISNIVNESFTLANSSFSFRFDNGSVADNLKIKVMVANDLDTTYEPYGDTIDEEFLKDVNVNFGEKYGPINTIVLSRSAGADNIYYPSTLPENPIEIKISDNQIMNGNNRADFMQEIYNKLNGLEYYINDYTSPGICYYNVCDKYNVMIGDTFYSCVMFNDEVNVTQGLEENVYTDLPEESVTDYTKADKDDRMLNQAYIIVDKVNKQINSLVSRVQDVEIKTDDDSSKIGQLETSVSQLQTDTYTKTEINQKLTDGSVTKVQTISGTFDENGMTYEKTNAPSKTTINEVGVGTKKTDGSDDYILFAGYVDDNNTQYADYKGQTIVATENIMVKNYLVVGTHSRFEDYENRTGCFWIK